MFFIQNIMITLAVAFYFIVFRTSRPPTPPSYAATRNHTSITQGLVKDTKLLLKNTNYLLVVLIFSLMYCIYAEIGIQVAVLFYPFPQYNTVDVAIMALAFVFFGSISAASTGVILDRTGKYLFTFRTILVVSTIIMALSLVMIPSNGLWSGVLWCILAGVFLVPIVPVTFNFTAEITHPLAPAAVLNFTLIAANVALIIVNFVFIAILKNKTKHASIEAFIVMFGIAAVSSLISLFVKEDLKRMASVNDLKLVEQQSMSSASTYQNVLSTQ
jgi:FLVCR family feline leukemia virus subgroup C receptor-related protein